MDLKNICRFGLLVLPAHLSIVINCSASDLPIGRFGSTNYGDWKIAGTAFSSGPASDGILTKLGIENSRDDRVASSEIEGDGPTGTLTSPEFKIARKYISFLIGGGDYEHDTCLNLLVHGCVPSFIVVLLLAERRSSTLSGR